MKQAKPLSGRMLWVSELTVYAAAATLAAGRMGRDGDVGFIAEVAMGFLLLTLLNISMHEAGHALAARCLGLPVQKVIIGSGRTLFQRVLGRTVVEIGAVPAGGRTIWIPAPATSLAARATITAAGPTVNLLTALVALAVQPRLHGGPADLAYCWFWVSLLMGLGNLIPRRLHGPEGLASDGLRLVQFWQERRITGRQQVVEALSSAGQPAQAVAFFGEFARKPGAPRSAWAHLSHHLYRAGRFEESATAHDRAASLWRGPELTMTALNLTRRLFEVDTTLAAALRDGAALPQEHVDVYTAFLDSPPMAARTDAAVLHTRSMLAIQRREFGRAAELALRAGADPDITPPERAMVAATAAIAFALGGHPGEARQWASQTPDWCPFAGAVRGALSVGSTPQTP